MVPPRAVRPSGYLRATISATTMAGALAALVLPAAGAGGSTPATARLSAQGVDASARPGRVVHPDRVVGAGRTQGPVDVLYAGSLVGLMEQRIGPAFDRATGATFNGFAGGSQALANEIKGRTQLADVFVSASPSVDGTLTGPANGNWVRWYATFATTPLVVGYDPHSRFAPQLRSKPWYEVVAQPGFLLGRTDPVTDPKGALTVEAMDRAAALHHEPVLRALATDPSHVYPEQGLVGLLQSGQLDAGFFYASEAAAAGIPTVPLRLGGAHLAGSYTVTVLDQAPHARAARAFVAFLLGRQGRSLLAGAGLTVAQRPPVTGARHVPADLRATLHVR